MAEASQNLGLVEPAFSFHLISISARAGEVFANQEKALH